MKPLVDCRLYAFIDTACLQGRAPELVAQQLCDGGADLIQLRAKNSTPDEVRRMAEAIQPITKRANIGLVINDHVDIANELETEFCHLGQEDFFGAGYKNVSELKGRDGSPSRPLWKGGTSVGRPGGATLPEVRIGLSTHSPAASAHETNREAGDAGIRPLGGGPAKRGGHSVVRHRRHQSGKS